MPIRNQRPTRFVDELRIISPWVFALVFLAFVSIVVSFVVLVGKDHNPPPVAVRWLLGIAAGAVLGCYIVLISYVNRDSGRRGMSRLLWTLVAIFVPNGLGIVLYFVLRKPPGAKCPQCECDLEPGFSFCPRCRYNLQPVCSHCQRSVNPGDKFCPYCGATLEAARSVSFPAEPSQS
jgi:hypothetical protein